MDRMRSLDTTPIEMVLAISWIPLTNTEFCCVSSLVPSTRDSTVSPIHFLFLEVPHV